MPHWSANSSYVFLPVAVCPISLTTSYDSFKRTPAAIPTAVFCFDQTECGRRGTLEEVDCVASDTVSEQMPMGSNSQVPVVGDDPFLRESLELPMIG